MNWHRGFARTIGLFVMAFCAVLVASRSASASCGSVTCFVVIGSQQQVSPQGLLTVNGIYNYTPQNVILSGTTGIIPAVDTLNHQMILNHHQEISTVTQTMTLDLNYGLTERFGIEVAIPYKSLQHRHIDGLGVDNGGAGTETHFTDSAIGDIFVNGKYNWLPTLRSMVVTGIGVYLPTGPNKSADPSGNGIFEPTAQLGRGAFGLQGSIYQTYEVIPHRLNEFVSASYRHTFRNEEGYQFGDQYDLGGGASLVIVDWFVWTTQVNYRYLAHDNCFCSLARAPTPGEPQYGNDVVVLDPTIRDRAVPTTGSSFTSISPGFTVGLGEFLPWDFTKMSKVYFFSQFPVARDFSGNLAQSVSYLAGFTQYFK